MKKHRGIRTLVVVSVVLMVLGSLCIGVGIAKGGDLRYLHVDKDTVDWWPFNGSFGIQLGDSFDFTSWEEEKHSYKERWDQSLQEVESLSLDVTLGDVRIERGKENKITFLDIRKEKVNIKQEKGNVTVTVDNPDISKGNRNRNDTIIVTLKDKQYERIYVEDKLGDIQLKNLSAKHITIEEKLGDITLEHIVSKDLAIAQSAGDIEVDGQLYGNSVVKSSMGNITIHVRGDQKDYRYRVKNTMGDTQIQNREWELSCEAEEGNRSSDNYLQLHSSMGDIDLQFEG